MLTLELIVYKSWRPKCFNQFEIKCLSQLFLIHIHEYLFYGATMDGYGHWKHFYFYSAGIDFSRQNLTSTDVRF